MSEICRLRDLIEVSESDVEHAASDFAAGSGGGRIHGFAAHVGAEKLNEALDKDVGEVLALGWSKVKAVRDAARRSLQNPGETSLVTLGQHELTSTHYPTLIVRVARLPAAEIRFTLDLVAQFKSVKLAISDGRIRSVSPGEASAIAKLKYGNVELGRKSTPAWKLPGEMRLPGDGIAVAH
jgi:hypothetical protein